VTPSGHGRRRELDAQRARWGQSRRRSPSAVPRRDLRPIIASRCSSTSRRRRSDDRAGQGAAPGCDHGGDRAAAGPEFVNWSSPTSTTTSRGHVRIYRRSTLRTRSLDGLLPSTITTPTACTRPTGAPLPRRADQRHHPAVATYHKLLSGHREGPEATRMADKALSPLIGKSLVVYLKSPSRTRRACSTRAPKPTSSPSRRVRA